MLATICKNVSYVTCDGAVNSYYINKILEAFKDIDNVLMNFEYKNEDIIDDIKRYIIGGKVEERKVKELEGRMKEWCLFFEDIGIEPSIYEQLATRYRKEFIIQYTKSEKKKIQPLVYLQYLFLIKKLTVATLEEQLGLIEDLKGKAPQLSNLFLNYITKPGNGNAFINRTYSISKTYVEKLQNEEFLIQTINEIFYGYLKQQCYEEYETDLKRIYFVQGNCENWVDMNKMNNFISDDKLALLKEAYLIDEIDEDHQHIVRLTDIAVSITLNRFIDKWESEKYYYESDKVALIPYNYNPLKISQYLFSENIVLKDSDFLIVFEREG